MMKSFTIKTSSFEGPLDLLLTLVEKKKLFISDISLAQVTDDFIEHLQKFDNLPIGDSAQFILIASTLLLIKSKSLLPTLTLTEEEEQGIHDLELRLKIYQRIKEGGVHVKKMFGEHIIFPQSKSQPSEVVFSPHKSMNLLSLAQAIKGVIASLPKKEIVPKVTVRKVISLEEMIDSLSVRITQNLRMKFSDFSAGHKHEKVNVIVSFLAMLELVKQGVIHAHQENQGDIHMETQHIGVPRYN